MILRRTTGPATPALSLDDAKMHLRVDGDAEDDYITSLAATAIAFVDGEGLLGRSILEQAWTQWVPQSPGVVPVKMGPFIELTGVSYYDAESVLQDAEVGDFEVRLDRDFVNVRPKVGKAWPSAATRNDAIALKFTAGHVEAPAGVVHALKLLVGHWYQNRAAVSDLTLKDVPMTVDSLINNERVGWYG